MHSCQGNGALLQCPGQHRPLQVRERPHDTVRAAELSWFLLYPARPPFKHGSGDMCMLGMEHIRDAISERTILRLCTGSLKGRVENLFTFQV